MSQQTTLVPGVPWIAARSAPFLPPILLIGWKKNIIIKIYAPSPPILCICKLTTFLLSTHLGYS